MFENDGSGWQKVEGFKNEFEFRQAYENPWTGPEENPRIIYIVAGDVHQARRWALEHRVAPPHWRVVLAVNDIRGCKGSFVRVGNYYQRKEADDIRETLDAMVEQGLLREIIDE